MENLEIRVVSNNEDFKVLQKIGKKKETNHHYGIAILENALEGYWECPPLDNEIFSSFYIFVDLNYRN